MVQKRLANIAPPTQDNDAVSLQYLNTNAMTVTQENYNAKSKKITALKDPENADEAVTLNYLRNNFKAGINNDNVMSIVNDNFNARSKKIQALKDPENADEAVTLNYVQKNYIQFPKKTTKHINLKQNRFIDAGKIPHTEPNTLTPAQYVKDVALCVSHNFDVPDPTGNHYDGKNKIIQNIKDPIDDNDAVNFKTLKDKALCVSEFYNDIYDAQLKIIRNVKEPEGSKDVANKHYVDYASRAIFRHVASAPSTPISNQHSIVKFVSTAGPKGKFLDVKDDSFVIKHAALLRITLYIEADRGSFELIMGDFVKRFSPNNYSHSFMINVEDGTQLKNVTMKTIMPALTFFLLWIIIEKLA
jgi:hypothetical protein